MGMRFLSPPPPTPPFPAPVAAGGEEVERGVGGDVVPCADSVGAVAEVARAFFDGDPFLEDGGPFFDDEGVFLLGEAATTGTFTVLRAVGVCGGCR